MEDEERLKETTTYTRKKYLLKVCSCSGFEKRKKKKVLDTFVEPVSNIRVVFPMAAADCHLRGGVARSHAVTFNGALLIGAHHINISYEC